MDAKYLKCAAGTLIACAVIGPRSYGQENYPRKPVRVIVPYNAGGGVDITARLLAEPLRDTFGQSFIVDNRPGASGMIGAHAVAKSTPDGYTLLLAAAGETAVNQHLYRTMSYNPETELTPVTLVVKIPNVVIVNPDVPAKNIQELIAYAKANPGKLNFSSSGVGNPQHLAGAMLEKMAGIEMVHVPMKGAAEQMTAIAGKQVELTFSSVAAALPFITGNKLRAIAVTGTTRVPALPSVSAVSEYNALANYELVNWFGFFAPAKTPLGIVGRLNEALVQVLKSPATAGKLKDQGMEPAPMTPEQARAFVKAESAKFAKIIKDANVKLP